MKDWKEQLRSVIRTPEQLQEYITLSDKEVEEIKKVTDIFKMSITPYYASLMDPSNPNCPIRKMVVPNLSELDDMTAMPNLDKEQEYESVIGLREEYHEKTTIILTYVCPNYCRHCFRKYWVGKSTRTLSLKQIDDVLLAIQNNEKYREVCITGGEPLIVEDSIIDYILQSLKKIQHVQVVRIFSRAPVFLPQRITDNLVSILKQYPTLYFCTHFNHKKELTKQAMDACQKLINAGIPVLNQTVLLKGINDDVTTMKELLWELVKNKIKPFYLYHCIKTTGTAHLVTPTEVGTDIIKELYGEMSALAIPLYTIPLYDGKALAMPSYEHFENGKKYYLNSKGEKFFIE